MIPGIVAAQGEGAPVIVTLNPSDKAASLTLSNGNLTVTKSSGGVAHCLVRATYGMTSGKWYWEAVIDATMTNSREIAAITKSTVSTGVQPGSSADGYGYNGINGVLYNNGAAVGGWGGGTYAIGDVIGIAFDANTGKLWFAKNGTWIDGSDPAAGTTPAVTAAAGTWYPTVGMCDQGGVASVRFDAADQTYSPPTGFSAFG